MEYSIVAFSQLTDSDLRRLAALHYSVMHTLLSDLGLPVVLRYYEIARADPNIVGLCACSPAGELVGWAMGSPYPDRINAQLRAPLVWFLLQMLRVALTRPVVLWQLMSSVLSASGEAEMKSGAIELTYIGVSSGQRARGLGKNLLSSFIEASRSSGFQSVVLSVETENLPAVSLYKDTGFQIIKTFSEGHYQRHRMELILA